MSSVSSSTRQLPPPSQFAKLFGHDPNVVFLNHGSFGSCPLAILEKQSELRARMEREPIRFFVEDLEGLLDGVRAEIGKFMNADPEGFVRVTNATEGVNTVVKSLKFAPGDELLTNTHEYNACNNVLRWAAEQWGAKVVSVDVPWPLAGKQQVIDAVLGGVTPRTKLVLLSHITSPTGVILPVAEIVRELNAKGVDCIVDGAHAPGMIPLDINTIDAPYYTGNCHKWMCAPKGAAFLWVRKDRRQPIRPLCTSHGFNSVRADRSHFRIEFDYTGTADVTPYLVLPEVIRYMESLIPSRSGERLWSGLMRHNHENALRGRDVLCRVLGQKPPAPDDMIGTLASVSIPDRLPMASGEVIKHSKYHDPLQDRLIEKWGIQAPVVVFPPGTPEGQPCKRMVRIAMQVYNTVGQVEYLAKALKSELAAGT